VTWRQREPVGWAGPAALLLFHREILTARRRGMSSRRGAGGLPWPHLAGWGPGWAAGAALAGGAALVECHFSFRIDSVQIALACSSEPLNGLSVPRDLR
jgi:hypothetical protein